MNDRMTAEQCAQQAHAEEAKHQAWAHADYDRALAEAKGTVDSWDLSSPKPLLQALKFLHDYVEMVTSEERWV